MLFQPTNVIPNMLGGAENSTVDVTKGLTISWQINGNSNLAAYRIGLYDNTVESTQLYTTGIITLPTPIPPVNYKGEQQRCTATISASALSSAGITNGNQYKIAIRQFWDTNNLDSAHSIRTSSDVVFLARRTAHVSITNPVSQSTLAGYAQTIIGQYYQGSSYSASEEYDPIEWVRWRIYDSADRGSTIYDSQKIYTQELRLDYDGFLNGRDYVIYLDIQNSVGQSAQTTAIYTVEWEAQTTKDVAVATQLNAQSSAVQVSWGTLEYIPAVINNAVYMMNSQAVIDNHCSLTYNSVNGSAMSFESPWGLLMHTTIIPNKANSLSEILTVTMSDSTAHTITYDKDERTLSISARSGAEQTADMYVGNDAGAIRIFINSESIQVVQEQNTGGLVPSATLTPSSRLTPATGDQWDVKLIANVSFSGTQGAITGITMGQNQAVDFIEVVTGLTSTEQRMMIDWMGSYENNNLEEIKTLEGIALLADYDTSLDAGNYSIGGERIYGWDIYRKRKSEAFARHLCTLELTQMQFLDYGCGSQRGKYTYFIYPRSRSGTHITNAIQSNTIQPVFWNWSIVEAEYNEDENDYRVLNEYIFRNNVTSGSVSNNNNPNVVDNFTQFPTVQMSSANYQSGTLSGLIGQVGFTSYVVQYGNSLVDLEERFKTDKESILSDNGLNTWENHGYAGMVIKLFNQKGLTEYFDDKEQRDLIWKLSTTTNHLFLKSRKGDVIEIKISGSISMETMDNTPQQAITASIPWVQVADAQDKSIIGGVGIV